MKRLLVLLAAVAATTGCSSVYQNISRENDVDLRYVAAVERAARQMGTEVVWVNYPRRRSSTP